MKHAIDTISTDQPSYGSCRIAVILERDHQLVVNRKAVQRHMREMGIAGISPGPNLSRLNPAHQVYPYLLRNLVAARPNHVWSIDRYRWRIQTPRRAQVPARAKAANRDVRVWARGCSRSQATTRTRLSATAISRCWRRVFASPM